MDISTLLALIAMITFGITAIIYKITTKHIDALSLTFLIYVFCTLFAFVVWLVFSKKQINLTGVGLSSLAALFAVIGFTAFMFALKFGKVSIVAPIRNLSLVVTVALAMIFLLEKISFVKVIGVIFAVIAIVLLSI